MDGRWTFLDETIDAAVRDASLTTKARIITSVASAGLIGICLGVKLALVWLAAIFICEAWTWISVRPLRAKMTFTRPERLNHSHGDERDLMLEGENELESHLAFRS
jgi:hypothetical protein